MNSGWIQTQDTRVKKKPLRQWRQMIRHEITFRYTKNNLCITNRLSTIYNVILVFWGNLTITDIGWISFDSDTEHLQAVEHLSPPKIIFVFKRAAFYSSENDIKKTLHWPMIWSFERLLTKVPLTDWCYLLVIGVKLAFYVFHRMKSVHMILTELWPNLAASPVIQFLKIMVTNF